MSKVSTPKKRKQFNMCVFLEKVAQTDSRAYQALHYIKSGDFESLKEFCENLMIIKDSLEETQKDRRLGNLIRKYPFRSSQDLVDETMVKFYASEKKCATVRLDSSGKREVFVQNLLAKILGVLTDEKKYEILLSGRHGPGSVGIKLPHTDNLHKDQAAVKNMSSGCSIYKEFLDYTFSYPGAGPCEYVKQDFSKLHQVPKTSFINRTIAIEPLCNMYIQLGIGDYMSRRLRALGIDLRDQSINQKAAKDAYCKNLATIDLSAASDSISLNLIKTLFCHPVLEPWYDFMYDVRSHAYEYEGEVKPFEKWSSMGNGFTFPLETMIFWCIAQLSKPEFLTVYGDDIIISQSCAAELIENLEYFGFSVNHEKTFTEGKFYESCGKEFYEGTDITTFICKKAPETTCDFYLWANGTSGYPDAQLYLLSFLDSIIKVPINCPPTWGLHSVDSWSTKKSEGLQCLLLLFNYDIKEQNTVGYLEDVALDRWLLLSSWRSPAGWEVIEVSRKIPKYARRTRLGKVSLHAVLSTEM